MRQQEVNHETGSSLSIGELKAHLHIDTLPLTRTHLFQQATSSNSATSNKLMGVNYIQIATFTKMIGKFVVTIAYKYSK